MNTSIEWGLFTCECLRRELPSEPDAGNLPVRFDEGRGGGLPMPPHVYSIS